MFSVGYDELCPSSELAAMQAEYLSEDLASVFLPRSKSDPSRDGASPTYLQPLRSGCTLGSLLRNSRVAHCFVGCTRIRPDVPLDTCSIRHRVKAAAARAGLKKNIVGGLSGHSMRIGAAQGMMVGGFDAIGIMQAGGWRTQAVLAICGKCIGKAHAQWEMAAAKRVAS